MITFIGDFSCRLDEKGRVLLPAAFIRQMANAREEKFIVKKDLYEICLVLYPMSEWEKQNQFLQQKTNPFNREHTRFLRGFYKGTAELVMDANNRLLLPKKLLDEIGADREIVMTGQSEKIEIWTPAGFERIESGNEQFAALAEKVVGSLGNRAGDS